MADRRISLYLMNSLTETRRARGMTQIDLAGRSTISQATISRLENGVNRGYRETHLKLAKALATPVGSIFPDPR